MNENVSQIAKHTLLIGSGKGGVGKSTVAVNLAVSLARQGFNVGLLDADLYGPSIPIMLGLRRMTPHLTENKVLPFTKFGVHILSIGFFIEEADAALWRGPRMHGILKKMIDEVLWGDLDFLLIDLPPGTGDVQISLSQLISIDGGIIVCTPQEVAMLDAIKAINLFEKLSIPLLGVIENMAGFVCPDTGKTHHIFGEGKAKELAIRFQTKLLGSIPLHPALRIGSDNGIPAAFHEGDNFIGHVFHETTYQIKDALHARSSL